MFSIKITVPVCLNFFSLEHRLCTTGLAVRRQQLLQSIRGAVEASRFYNIFSIITLVWLRAPRVIRSPIYWPLEARPLEMNGAEYTGWSKN